MADASPPPAAPAAPAAECPPPPAAADAPPPPAPARHRAARVVDASATPVSFQAQVTHKRTNGNKLVFCDVHKICEGAPAAAAARAEEVVFDFEVYGDEVRRVRKDIAVGDVVAFRGHFRPCGTILDAVAYTMVERWSEVGSGIPFEPFRSHAAEPRPPRKIPINDSSALVLDGRPLCKYWLSNGVCHRVGCHCDHPEGEALQAAKTFYREAQRKRKARSANADDPHSVEDKRSHARRAEVLADWLCSTYGLEALRAGGVLDVAGGRGELAFELCVKRGIPCTVVDPRCPGPASEGAPAARPWAGWRLTRQQRSWLEANVEGLGGSPACQAHVEACPLRQCRACAPNADACGEEEVRRWSGIVGSCVLVTGLHPDQATGAAAQLAKAFGKPFAVVPCCTFADDFPDRRLPDGRLVRTYEELISWLREQNAGARVEYLPFHGKNAVVFTPDVG